MGYVTVPKASYPMGATQPAATNKRAVGTVMWALAWQGILYLPLVGSPPRAPNQPTGPCLQQLASFVPVICSQR
jgi:hypothetical protein